MRLILRYLKAYRREFLLGLLCLVVTNALTLSVPWLLKEAVETLRRRIDSGAVGRYALLIAAVAVVLAVVRTASRLLVLGASRHVVYDIRNAIFARLTTLPPSYYGRTRTGEIMSRAVNDLLLVRSLFGPGVLNVVNVALLFTAGLAFMVALDPGLAFVAVLPYPFLLYGVFRASRAIHERSNAAQEQLAEISNKAQENLSGVQVVKAFGREDAEVRAFESLAWEYRRRSLLLARSRGLIVALMGALGSASTIAVLWIGGLHVIDGRLTLGGFVAFMSYLALLTGPTIMMGWVLGVFERGLGAIRRIESVLQERSELPGDHAAGGGPEVRGAVAFRNLTFAHADGGRAQPVLRGVDLDVPAGSTVGVIGRVGSGKTTLVSLLGAVHAAPPGTVFVDGRDINDIPTGDLRARVGIVPQETFLFSRTIAENIALGVPSAPRERIEHAAALAQVTRDVADFPHGLDTRVGERGITLSGGQRQRVALARALLIDPRILVLDDALSSVDADTERAVLDGLRGFMRGRTTFVVAHRASTVLAADTIVVLDDGRIVERGAPADLLERDGPFARLYRRQRLQEELESL